MNWFFIALISPFLWAITNHIDKHLVARYSKEIKFTSFIITSAIFFSISAILIFYFKPEVINLQWNYIMLVLLAGICFVSYLFPYYYALREEEASIVVPMFQMVPFTGFIFGYIFLREHLNYLQIIAGLIIIAGSLGLSLDFQEKFRLKSKIFFLMLFSSLLVSLGALLYKVVATQNDFWTAVFWEEIGVIISSLILLLVKTYRQNFVEILRKRNYWFIGIMGINDVLSWGAGIIFSYAYLLAPIALVQLIGSVQPLFVLILGIIGSLIFPRLAFDMMNGKILSQKIFFIVIILFGSYLLFTNL